MKTQLFIDEFDLIRGFSDAQLTIQRLRDLVYHQYDTGLSGGFHGTTVPARPGEQHCECLDARWGVRKHYSARWTGLD